MALAQHDRREKTMPFLAVSLLALLCGFLLNNRIAQQQIISDNTTLESSSHNNQYIINNQYFDDYLNVVKWQINTMLHPIDIGAGQGKEDREVLVERLSHISADIKALV